MKTVAIVAIIAFSVSGCASIFHGTSDTIYLRSDEPDTQFYLNNRDVGKGTSAVTTVQKKNLSTSILRAEKMGCNAKSSPIETQFDATTLLGILIDWGIISILIVDWGANGAVTRAAQNDYVLTPDCPKQQRQQQLVQPAQQIQINQIMKSQIVESEGSTCMGEDKSRKQTEKAAILEAKKKAIEYVSSHVVSHTDVNNFEVDKDIISAYANADVRVIEELNKGWYEDSELGNCYRVKIKAEVIPIQKF